MLSLLISLALTAGLQEGDHWTTERTMQFVETSAHVDVKVTEQLQYRVEVVEAELYAIRLDTKSKAPALPKSSSILMKFKSGGVPISEDDTSDPNLARIHRMEWTALEPRKGISWSRNWTARPGLADAKVIVKPTSRTASDTTFLVTYKEGEKTKGVATIKIFNEVPVIEDVALTLNDVEVPGATKLGSLIVTEKLKDLHVAG